MDFVLKPSFARDFMYCLVALCQCHDREHPDLTKRSVGMKSCPAHRARDSIISARKVLGSSSPSNAREGVIADAVSHF